MNVVPLRPMRAHSTVESAHTLVETRRLRPARRLHLLDIENLCGTSHLTTSMVKYVLGAYLREIGIGPSDHVIFGVSHHNLLTVGQMVPDVRLCVRSGSDGADLVLLDVLVSEQVENRFSEICLGTGDGLFTDIAATMAGRAVHIRVVAGFGSASKPLRLAAGTFTQLSFAAPIKEHA